MPKSEKQRLRRKARVKKLKRKIVRGTGETWPGHLWLSIKKPGTKE